MRKNSILNALTLGGLALSLSACGGSNNPSTPVNHTSYVQFERLARPAVKELFETFVNHQVTNGVEPYNDPTLQGSIIAFTNTFRASTYGAALGGAPGGTAGVLYPDELAFDLSQTTPASYLGIETGGATSPSGSKFGGRALSDDVIDISLGAIFGNTLSALGLIPDDHKEAPCLAEDNVPYDKSNTDTFPYIQAPL